MRDKKRQFLPYSLYDYDAYARHFAKMARRGWMVEGTAPFTWVYRRCEPRELTFAVSYFARASAFDPEPGEEQSEFIAFCERTGWHLAVANAQMQVFYNERENPVPIETDPALEVESVHRAMKRVYLPVTVIAILLALTVLQLLINADIKGYSGIPLDLLANGMGLAGIAAQLLLIIYCLVELAAYFLWLYRARRVARETGTLIPSAGHRRFQIVMFTLMLALLAASLVSSLLYGGRLVGFVALSMTVLVTATSLITWFIRKLMMRLKMPKTLTMLATLGTATVLSVAVVATVTSTGVSLSQNVLREDAEELPLTFTDLYEGDDYQESIRRDGSPILTRLSVLQYERAGDRLNYTLYEVQIPSLAEPLRDLVLRDLEEDGTVDGEHYLEADPTPWHADHAFQKDWQGKLLSDWLLFYPGRILFFDLNTEPTPELMDTVAEKLGGKGE